MIEADVTTYLAGQSAIAAIIGPRIYPYRVPQTAVRPLLVFESKTKEPSYHQGGESDLDKVKITLTSQAETYLAAKELAAAVRAELSGFNGTMGGSFVNLIEMTDETDDMDQGPSGEETGIFKIVQDYSLMVAV